ncbi:MAG TPA: hypothetical protein VK656_02370, partial [Candidatus Acidoferrum sp.]|nr:hypothetical protein [Candidatus Acidoferrum sp.]
LHLAWLGLIGGLSLAAGLAMSPHLMSFWQPMFPLVLWLFVPGMCLAVVEDRLPAWLGRPAVVIVGGLLVATGAYVAPWPNSDVLTASGAATLVAWVLVRRPTMPRWVGLGAALSYAFYLWHVDVVRFVAPLGPWPIAVPVALAVTGAIAYVSYRCVERPVLDAAHGLGKRGRSAPTAAAKAAAATPASARGATATAHGDAGRVSGQPVVAGTRARDLGR